MSRKEACIVLGVNYKTIEKFKNGRTKLLKKRVDKKVLAYGFKLEDYSLCRKGNIKKIKEEKVRTHFWDAPSPRSVSVPLN